MAQIPKGRLVKGPYKPICRDSAIYFLITVIANFRPGISKYRTPNFWWSLQDAIWATYSAPPPGVNSRHLACWQHLRARAPHVASTKMEPKFRVLQAIGCQLQIQSKVNLIPSQTPLEWSCFYLFCVYNLFLVVGWIFLSFEIGIVWCVCFIFFIFPYVSIM